MVTRRTNIDRSGSSWGWIAGALIVLLLLGGFALFWNPAGTNMASNNATSSAPATTGAGSPSPSR